MSLWNTYTLTLLGDCFFSFQTLHIFSPFQYLLMTLHFTPPRRLEVLRSNENIYQPSNLSESGPASSTFPLVTFPDSLWGQHFPKFHSFVLLKMKVKVAQSCPTLFNPMVCTVYGILQARILEWVGIFPSPGILPTQGSNPGFHIAGTFFTSWATRGALTIY